jgi:hypothetical protein
MALGLARSSGHPYSPSSMQRGDCTECTISLLRPQRELHADPRQSGSRACPRACPNGLAALLRATDASGRPAPPAGKRCLSDLVPAASSCRNVCAPGSAAAPDKGAHSEAPGGRFGLQAQFAKRAAQHAARAFARAVLHEFSRGCQDARRLASLQLHFRAQRTTRFVAWTAPGAPRRTSMRCQVRLPRRRHVGEPGCLTRCRRMPCAIQARDPESAQLRGARYEETAWRRSKRLRRR